MTTNRIILITGTLMFMLLIAFTITKRTIANIQSPDSNPTVKMLNLIDSDKK